MRRTQIDLDEDQADRLACAAGDAGMTKSALIRKAIDALLEQEGSEAARLECFHEASAEAAGCAPDLPPGEEYVEGIRLDYAERELCG